MSTPTGKTGAAASYAIEHGITLVPTTAAGPDYWFLAPDPIDRLADDECPMDEMTEVEFQVWLDDQAAQLHFRTCAMGIGPHPASECPR